MNRLEAAMKAKDMTVFARIDHAAGAAEKMIVAGNYITEDMKFTGHFTSKLGQNAGRRSGNQLYRDGSCEGRRRQDRGQLAYRR
jgi:hypothetical protein